MLEQIEKDITKHLITLNAIEGLKPPPPLRYSKALSHIYHKTNYALKECLTTYNEVLKELECDSGE